MDILIVDSPVWKETARHLAGGRKERMLSRDPMMDRVAVKLNRHPTWDETKFVEQFLRDIHDIGFDLIARPKGEDS